MRHYYRFMELEPVLEQEEDSVGEVSPTSSMGSPSFSPPPDAWAQISSKDYHDPLSSHLLQEHLDLQRAYRLLEVQLQKYDTRDLQRMKDALPAQERLREELQRTKEREAALRGEIYDLHEQNELLEFRILELEECQENASTTRSGGPASRDVATETDNGDVTDAGQTPLPVDSETQRIQERLCESPATEPESATHGCGTRLAPDDKDCSLALSTTPVAQQPAQDEADCAPHPLSEGISCTLCRRLPRRRSNPEPCPPTPDQRDSLRKSKSDGEIIARRTGEREDSWKKLDAGEGRRGQVHRCVGTQVSTRDEGVQVQMEDRTPRTPLFGGRVEDQVRTVRTMLTSIYHVIQETRVEVECTNSELREEVQTLESTVQRLKQEAGRGLGGGEGPPVPPPFRRSRSLSFSKDCYCCSQDLQPSLEEVITKLQQVMDLVTDTGVIVTLDPDKTEEEEDDDDVLKYEEEKPEGTDENVGITTVEHAHKEEDGKESRDERVSERNSAGSPRSESLLGVSEAKMLLKTGDYEGNDTKETRSAPLVKRPTPKEAMPTNQVTDESMKSKLYTEKWTPERHTEEHDLIRRSLSQDLSKVTETRRPDLKPKMGELVTNKGVDIPPLRGVVGGSFTDPPEMCGQYNACVTKGTDEAIKHLEELAPLPEEKTKPVLRRWREQLLVRRDRVQPWRIEMLDFPKRLPSVV